MSLLDTPGFVERVFPIRVQIDPEKERRRLGRTEHSVAQPYSYKRTDGRCCHLETPSVSRSLQSFGALVALRALETHRFEVIAASENVELLIGHTPQALFSLYSFPDVIIVHHREGFGRRLKALHNVAPELRHPNTLDVFSTSIISCDGRSSEFWCTLHLSRGSRDVLICEFEPVLHSGIIEKDLRKPTKKLNYQPTPEERARSITRKSIPLFALKGVQDRSSAIGTADLISTLNEVQGQLASSTSMNNLFDTVVGTVSELTKFDRVMLYRFDEGKCGAVVAEIVNPQASEDVFIGLHFPSSDLLPGTRDLYKAGRVQILRNRIQQTVKLVHKTGDRLAIVDLIGSYLREITPDQEQFFSDLDVSSSMTLSLIVENELWGLITCHSYGSHITIISPPMREVCRSIGSCVASQVERLLSAERLEARILLATALSRKSPGAFITASSSNLLEMFVADFGMLVMDDEARAIGKLQSYHEALALVHYFRARGVTSVFASQKITVDLPDLEYPPGFSLIAGLLTIPLSSTGADFLVMFRKEQLMEIHWAGNAKERLEQLGGYNLEPREGFQRWIEHVVNTSRDWTEWQLEMGCVLGTLYSTFASIWRQKEAVAKKSRMRRLLISNASHEVRTPLNHIINNLEVALDNELDQSTHEHLETSLTASKSLIYVINDLLDLTKVEETEMLLHEQDFVLEKMLLEVMQAFRGEAARKGLKLSFKMEPGLPKTVKGDPEHLRQAISNILGNSAKNSPHGDISISVCTAEVTKTSASLEIMVEDQGQGMSEEQLDLIFQDIEQLLDENNDVEEGLSRKSLIVSRNVGLGLAVVARFVRNCKGQIKVRSRKGVGTRVSILIPLLEATPKLRASRPTSPNSPDSYLENHDSRSPTISRKFNGNGRPSIGNSLGSIDLKLKISNSRYSLTEFTPSSEISTPSSLAASAYPFPSMSEPSTPTGRAPLHILVAEDNPLNMKLLNLRLTRLGHRVTMTVDGGVCFEAFKLNPSSFDVIFMDFQMPLIDGPTSTAMIRKYEREASPQLSPYAELHGHIPIFALSASLIEAKRQEYIDCGFNAWVLKPISFHRLDELMKGVHDQSYRNKFVYSQGFWENGGWLEAARPVGSA